MSERSDTGEASAQRRSPLLVFVRLVLPVLIIIAGIALAAIGRSESAYEVGALLISAGLSVALLNLLYRVGVKGDSDRDREADARDYFERTGHWPSD